MSGEWVEGCAHYYADPSGGFGWPSCVKCGAPVPTETARLEIRACCRAEVGQAHRPWCNSLDARQSRGQAGLGAMS